MCSVPAACVIGLQWGDEAKGKLVDLLARITIAWSATKAARTRHTVVCGAEVYKLHHVPSAFCIQAS